MAYLAEPTQVAGLILQTRQQVAEGRKIVAHSQQLIKFSLKVCDSVRATRKELEQRAENSRQQRFLRFARRMPRQA